jgi:hypothetical protein
MRPPRPPVPGVLVPLLLAAVVPASAQHHDHQPDAHGWTTTVAAQAFLTLNLQERKFTDVRQVESTNWLMLGATRTTARTRLTLVGMASAEPWTLRRLGSAQVFQAGETLDDLPLRDYQHPHDLLMAAEVRFDWQPSDRHGMFVAAGLVGSPALGPTPFMHRTSASLHPTAPLSHHMLDSTHITHGVVTAGVAAGAWTAEASLFRGREPDEDRVALELGPLDSLAGRLGWQRDGFRVQVSAARVHEPEALEPGDAVKVTASVEYASSTSSPWTWTAAVGRNGREDHVEWGGLVEAVRMLSPRWRAYGRAELVDRFVLVDFDHAIRTGEERHLRSRVGALTVGLDRVLWRSGAGQIAMGGDLSVHHTPANLRDSYGRPVSVHVFIRATR